MKQRAFALKRPFLVICVPGIAVVAALISLTSLQVHPDFNSKAAISVAPTDQDAYRRIRWSELIPSKWDSKALFEGQDISAWGDTDPRALLLQRRMQAVWSTAPVNQALDRHAIRTAGYVVPIEESGDGISEFLLVPYFGSCIHIPPPPANQIIDVSSPKPVKGVHSMDAVWVSGVLRVAQIHHDSGDSAYALQADAVDIYTGPAQ